MSVEPVLRKSAKRRVQAGGTLDPRRHIYIARPEDDELLRLLLDGQYANILTSRQTGKSSLVVNTIYRLRERGLRTGYVDLTSIGTPGRVEDYYKGLLDKICRHLGLGVDLNAWWHGAAGDTINQRLMRFFRECVAEAADSAVIIFLDEIDSTLKLDYTDDLFTALRAMYNERWLVPAYERISFCLVGVATPNELIKDRRTTAYNVGRTLTLREFDAARDDLGPLAAALGDDPEINRRMLARVLHWTGGHPYLTMRVCLELIERRAQAVSDVDRLINEDFQTLERVSSDTHFQQVLRFVEARLSRGLETLLLYQRILEGRRERDAPTLAHTELKLSGLVKRDADGYLVVHNPIYGRLFDRRWVEGTRPRRALARYRNLAAAASIAVVVVGGGLYSWLLEAQREITTTQAQLEQARAQLSERDQLAQLGITITAATQGPGNAIAFPPGAATTQATFEEALPLLRSVQPVVSLDLASTRVADISGLSGLTDLRWLDLGFTDVADIGALSDLTDLEWLELSGTKIADIAALSGMTNLRWLNLRDTEVADATALSDLAGLEWLFLRDTRIEDITALSGLVNLEWLDLSRTEIADVTALSGLAKLRRVDLSGTRVSDITALSGLVSLQVLDLRDTRVADITALSDLADLQWLDLGGTRVTPAAVAALRAALAARGGTSVRIDGP